MKRNFKMAAVILVGMICSMPYLSNARAHMLPPKAKSVRAKRPALAAMKIKNIQFGFNKAEVPSDAYSSLDKVAKLMQDNKAALKLGGYADNKGGYVYNWKLSKKRADAVKAYLINKGSDSTRIAAVEYGYTHPVASNKTTTGRQKNRRVEIHFAD